MEETAFYVLGITVVVVALVLSAIGLRSDRFPGSRAGVVGVAALVLALVAATGAFAWMFSVEHQEEHAAELAGERAEAVAEHQEALADQFASAEGEGLQESEGEQDPQDVDGQQVFEAAGCAGCHTLAAAGSNATVGPNLDEELPGQSPADIERSIVDPEAETTAGFAPGLMPDDFEERLSEAEIDALVRFLSDSTS